METLPAALRALAAIVGGQALFARVRAAFDPAGTLNPAILPRSA
jgi:hypothetical protein